MLNDLRTSLDGEGKYVEAEEVVRQSFHGHRLVE